MEIKSRHITIAVTVISIIIGSPFLYNWIMRPVLVIDVKQFDLPKVYSEMMKDEISKIPKISTIEISNIGRSVGSIITLDFKTNSNTTVKGINVETTSKALKYEIEKVKDGSSVLKIDIEYLRPQEKVDITVLTDIRANLVISKRLILNGAIVTKEKYETQISMIALTSGLLTDRKGDIL